MQATNGVRAGEKPACYANRYSKKTRLTSDIKSATDFDWLRFRKPQGPETNIWGNFGNYDSEGYFEDFTPYTTFSAFEASVSPQRREDTLQTLSQY